MFKFFLSLFMALVLGACQKTPERQPRLLKEQNELPPAVAKLSKIVPTVMFRSGTQPEWGPASLGPDLRNRDELKTSKGASAIVDFVSDKSRLDIEENSFVVIWDGGNTAEKVHVVALPEGAVRGTLSPEEKSKMEVRTPGGWVKAQGGNNGADFKVSSKTKKVYKVTVSKGEALIETGKGKTTVRAGRTADLVVEDTATDIKDYKYELPLNSFLVKDKKFSIELPYEKEFKTKNGSVRFSGVFDGNFTVWANGVQIEGNGEGRFEHVFNLVPGLNVITFQVSDPETKKVEYFIYKVTRLLP